MHKPQTYTKTNTNNSSWKNKGNTNTNTNWSTNKKKSYTNTQNKYSTTESAIKNWVIKNKNTLTFEDVNNQFILYKSEESMNFYIISQLIKNISNDNNIITVLEQIQEKKLWPRYEKTKQLNNYGLFHIASYIKSGCNYKIFERVVKLLYTCGNDPFSTNDRLFDDEHETALMGLFQSNNNLEEDERVERYKIYLNNIPPTLNQKILNRYLNKTIDKATDIARFFLCIDLEHTIEVISRNLLLREYKDINLGTINNTIDDNAKFIISIISGSDDSYKNVFIHDKSLRKFFELGEKKCPNMNELFKMFYMKMEEIIVTSKNENTKRNEVVFARMLGSLGSRGKCVNECNNYIYTQLDDNNIEHLIHTICHVGYITQDMKDILLSIDTSSNLKIEFALQNIFDKGNADNKNNMTYIPVEEDDLGIYDYYFDFDKIETIKKIQCGKMEYNMNRQNLNIRDMLRQIEKTYEKYPDDSYSIVQQILFTILDSSTIHDRENVPKLVEILIEDNYITPESVKMSTNYIMKLIKNNQLDCSPSLCLDTWNLILKSSI